MEKIKLGISRCLLGDKVRYNGDHSLDHYLAFTLSKFIDWVGVCPEVECGLGVPREPMELKEKNGEIILVTKNTGVELTERFNGCIKKIIEKLKKEELYGFIFRNKSPSCGLKSARVYKENNTVNTSASGIFATAIKNNFPDMPVEESSRLYNPELRENFFINVIIYYRWKNEVKSINDLIIFHSKNKFLIMSYNQKKLRLLGKLIGEQKKYKKEELFNEYFKNLKEALIKPPTKQNHINTLEHIYGYFKKDLSDGEKKEFKEILLNYRKGLIPLIVPLTILTHYAKKYKKDYIVESSYLNPLPLEMVVRI